VQGDDTLTQADFIASLKGDKGDPGEDGLDGDNIPFVNILEGDDAYISGSDLNEEGKVDVAIALPDDAQVNDTLTVNGVDTTITQDMINNGFITSVDVPDSGTLFVRATVEYADGSQSGTGKDFARVGLIARDDADELELGDLQIAQTLLYSNETYDLLNLAEGTNGSEGGLGFTVSESSNGTVGIEVSQSALVTVADAILIEVYDSNGDRIYIGANNGSPLIGNLVGMELLGLTGNDTLTATVSGLEPGDYTIVVRNDESALEALVNDLTLAELGEAGVILGPDNQAAVLDAVEASLNGSLGLSLGTVVTGVLEGVLDLTTDIGVGELVNIITDNAVINTLLGGVVDPLLNAVADALLSNTVTLLETTNITATLTEFDYADDTAVTGNVIDPDVGSEGEDGEDTVTSATTLTAITSNNVSESVPTSTEVGGVEVFTITGQYGVLVIDENGEYTYTANGDYTSAGQTEIFTYTIANGNRSDMAELVIELAVDTTPPDAPTINTPIADDSVVNSDESENGFTVTGTGDFGDTITLTDETDDVIGTAIVDISGNWSVLVDQADVAAMGEGSETITVIATDPFGNVSDPASVDIDVDTLAPAAPTLNVNEAGTEITGESEADAFVEIDVDGDSTVDYSTTADGNGDYVIDSSADPLINGETVTATATDAAGNESDPSTVEVPIKLVANDDPAVAGLDVTPTSSTTTSDDDSSLKNEETSVLNLLGIGSFEVSVDFTVAANNIGSAEVNFSSTGIANVLDNGSLVLQKKDGNGIYVNVDSAASATGLLNVLDLLGDGVPDGYTLSGLTAGDYRLVGSVNPAVGLITTGTLEVVTLTETSITGIDDIQAVNATGNVIDENDVSTNDTVVTTVNGGPINASGDTSITGTYGTLLINADGDYTYTPTEDASGIDKEDVFSYTIEDTETGSTDSATLTVSIESDYPAVDFPIDAVDDFATAELVIHPETVTPQVTLADGPKGVTVLTPRTLTDEFDIAAGNIGSVSFTVVAAGVLPTTTVRLEKWDSGSWETVTEGVTTESLSAVGLLGNRVVLAAENLEPGTYRAYGRGSGVAASIEMEGVVTEITPNEPGIYDSIVASGNVISENDEVTLSTVVTEVEGVYFTGSTDIVGSYGTLTMNADGSYFYTPNPNVNVINQVESFEYTILDDYGNTDTATLTINITSDWASPALEPTITTPIASDDVVDGDEAENGFDVTGTGEVDATIILTDEAGNVIGTTIVDAAGNWSIPVDQADVDAMGQGLEMLTATATDTSGNVSDPVTADITVDTEAAIEVTVNDLTSDNVIDAAEAGATATVQVSGTVTGDFQVNDTVTLTVNEVDYTANIDTAGNYSIDVAGSELVADDDNEIGVGVTTTDVLGNIGTANTVKEYMLGPIAVDDTASAELEVATVGGGIIAISTSGNVMGENDIVTSGTVVSEVNGVTIGVATLIQGDYGQLVIGSDGAYTYKPNNTDTSGINQVDEFEYTIDDGNGYTDIATLSVTIESTPSEPVSAGMNASSFTLVDDIDNAIELPDTSLITSNGGLDTFIFEGADQVISLSDMMQPDIIDISGVGANTLNVATNDVESDIYVKGDSDDTVDLEGDSWSNVAQTTLEGDTYNVWQSGTDISTQVYIDTDITNVI
ncbi:MULTISPECIES: beta strand repeat-containing protein, partial [unclassified Psychrobacter]|uniref:beta strand repeat-containing protein n=1 Tax=unclassified Psychrobacter TaxID=196806 RepID=UPI00402B325B